MWKLIIHVRVQGASWVALTDSMIDVKVQFGQLRRQLHAFGFLLVQQLILRSLMRLKLSNALSLFHNLFAEHCQLVAIGLTLVFLSSDKLGNVTM